MFLSDSGLLGASPDGTVSDHCIIEVNNLYTVRIVGLDFFLFFKKEKEMASKA